ncbi:hypothetical protein E4U52_000396 [Claviceps spartinae]|nr:hypothetical protein E4U52_000396 [Claviceps spartinae]
MGTKLAEVSSRVSFRYSHRPTAITIGVDGVKGLPVQVQPSEFQALKKLASRLEALDSYPWQMLVLGVYSGGEKDTGQITPGESHKIPS